MVSRESTRRPASIRRGHHHTQHLRPHGAWLRAVSGLSVGGSRRRLRHGAVARMGGRSPGTAPPALCRRAARSGGFSPIRAYQRPGRRHVALCQRTFDASGNGCSVCGRVQGDLSCAREWEQPAFPQPLQPGHQRDPARVLLGRQRAGVSVHRECVGCLGLGLAGRCHRPGDVPERSLRETAPTRRGMARRFRPSGGSAQPDLRHTAGRRAHAHDQPRLPPVRLLHGDRPGNHAWNT
jgi:hypothetical protein